MSGIKCSLKVATFNLLRCQLTNCLFYYQGSHDQGLPKGKVKVKVNKGSHKPRAAAHKPPLLQNAILIRTYTQHQGMQPFMLFATVEDFFQLQLLLSKCARRWRSLRAIKKLCVATPTQKSPDSSSSHQKLSVAGLRSTGDLLGATQPPCKAPVRSWVLAPEGG